MNDDPDKHLSYYHIKYVLRNTHGSRFHLVVFWLLLYAGGWGDAADTVIEPVDFS